MFHKLIVELQKARKFLDHRAIDLADNQFLSNIVCDSSYSLTLVIKDLVRVEKILRKQEEDVSDKSTNQDIKKSA